MDGLQFAGAGALNIFNQVVKEQNAMGRHADRIDHVPKRFGLWFAQPDIGRNEHLPERAQQVSETIRQALYMLRIGIGERIKRESFGRARQQIG